MEHSNGNGFGVITGELTGYARHTGQLAKDLHALASHRVRPVREHGFGPIGKETGFAAALQRFAEALERQVAGVARNAGELGDSVAKAAHTYQEHDQDRAAAIVDMIRGQKR